jgi:probable phosphomutase (TIGR03848 family)
MSTVVLLRHAHSTANDLGLLTGRLPGVKLSKDGKKQALALVERIGGERIDSIHISPMERCHLTIDPWLKSPYSKSLTSFEICDELTELDFGSWSGKKLSTLRRDPLWKVVQHQPSRMTFPGGESFRVAQNRAFGAVESILQSKGDRTHLVVSHSDTIKLIIAKYLDIKLDTFQRLQINPASFSIVNGSKSSRSIRTINNSERLRDLLS